MAEFQCTKCHGVDFVVLANQCDLVCRKCGKHIDIFVTQLKVGVITKKELREKLAELEHKQWAHWTEYMLANMSSENQKRWFKQVKLSYQDLSEKEKDSDREWADKVLSIVAQCVIESGGELWTRQASKRGLQERRGGDKTRQRDSKFRRSRNR